MAAATALKSSVPTKLADVLSAQGRLEEADAQLDAARCGFDEVLARHLLAFADHAAEFYARSGHDRERALELVRMNVANRPTRRARQQVQTITANVRLSSHPAVQPTPN